jgi:hypothetical protein
MIENLMIASIFITTMMTLVVLGLLIVAGLCFGAHYIREWRKGKIQKRLNDDIKRMERNPWMKEVK